VKNTPDFDILHRWTLRARPEELTEIVLDTSCYDKWCSRALMRCEVVSHGRSDGLGLTVRLHTKGWLPHSFLFTAKVVDLVAHRRMTIRVSGDFEGVSLIDVTEDRGGTCDLTLRWSVDVAHPVVRRFVPFTRYILARNHTWATNSVRRMLQAEVDRRRAGDHEITAPPPTFAPFVNWLRPLHRRREREMGWSSDSSGDLRD